jgi:hypothetical protein
MTNGGTNAVYVDTSQRVGIGTTSAGARLHISDGSTASALIDPSGGTVTYRTRNADNTAHTSAIYDATQHIIRVEGNEACRLDTSRRLLVGTSTSLTTAAGFTPNVQIAGTVTDPALSVFQYRNAAGAGASITLSHSRGASVGTQTILQSGDSFGQLIFEGSDGTNPVQGALIKGEVDGTPGNLDMPGRIVLSTTSDGASSPTERMRINNSGQILIGKASDTLSTAGWAIDGGSTIGRGQLTCGSSGAPILRLNHTGGAATEYVVESWKNGTQVGSISVTASATAYNTSSDYRLKENVIPLTGAIDRLQQIPVHRFNFIADPDKTVDGFIAHEAQEIVPECVTGEKDAVDDDGNPVYQGIDQSKLVPLLTAALQEAIGRIETLEAEVAALKAS